MESTGAKLTDVSKICIIKKTICREAAMNKDLAKAKKILLDTGATCVLCKGGSRVDSQLRGVTPLMELLDTGMDFSGYSAADKVVGKATAFLYCLLGVTAVYAPVVSEPALAVLEANGIDVEYEQCVPAIFNHRKDGLCPMETATKALTDPEEALDAIRRTLEKLNA